MKEEKISHLQTLLQSEGWRIIQEELREDIRITEAKLFGEMKMLETETIDQLRRERIDRLELLVLPEAMIRELTEVNNKPDYDSYD
jgi:hypothetical protein